MAGRIAAVERVEILTSAFVEIPGRAAIGTQPDLHLFSLGAPQFRALSEIYEGKHIPVVLVVVETSLPSAVFVAVQKNPFATAASTNRLKSALHR